MFSITKSSSEVDSPVHIEWISGRVVGVGGESVEDVETSLLFCGEGVSVAVSAVSGFA